MNVQSRFMSTFIFINIARLFRPANPRNHNFNKIMQKREIFFVYLPNTSHFMHFQSVHQRNETFINRLINTGGTSGQNLTRLRR